MTYLDYLNTLILGGGSGEGGGGYPEPTGSIEITENGTHDVKDFAEAVVAVDGGEAVYTDVFIEGIRSDWDEETESEVTIFECAPETMKGVAVGDAVIVFGKLAFGTQDSYFIQGTVTAIPTETEDEEEEPVMNVHVLAKYYQTGGITPYGSKTITVNGTENVRTDETAVVQVQGGDDGTTIMTVECPSGYTEIRTTQTVSAGIINNWKVGGKSSSLRVENDVTVAKGDEVGYIGLKYGTAYEFCVYGEVSSISDYTNYKRITIAIDGIIHGDDPTITITENGTVNVKGRDTAVVNVSGGGSDDQFVKLIERTGTEYASDDVTVIEEYVFYKNHTVTSIDFPNAEAVKSHTCDQAVNLVKVNLPKAKTIASYAFQKCSKLKDINVKSAESIDTYAFDETSVTAVDAPALAQVKRYVFRNCPKLVASDINMANVTDVLDYAFQINSYAIGLGDRDATKLYLPKVTSISGMAFSITPTSTNRDYASWISEVDLPECTTLGVQTFYGQAKLKKAHIPNATAINGAFVFCDALEAIIIKQTDSICTIAAGGLANTPIASGTGYVYVPDALVDDYKTATNWVTYADQIKPLSEYVEA